MTKKLAIILGLTALLLLSIVGIKFSGIGQREEGVLGTAEAQTLSQIRPCHPRIWITDDCDLNDDGDFDDPGETGNLNDLRNSFFSGDKQAKYANLKNNVVDGYINQLDTFINDPAKQYLIVRLAQVYAFVYQIEKQQQYADAAKTLLEAAILIDATPISTGNNVSTSAAGIAITYDWINETLSTADKQRYVQAMLGRVDYWRFPNTVDWYPSPWAGDSWSPYFPKANGFASANPAVGLPNLYVGIAIYGDGINDPRGEQITHDYGDYLENQVIPAFNLVSGETGGWQEDNGHTIGGFEPIAPEIDAMRTSQGKDLFSNFTSGESFLRFFLYVNRPDNGFWMQGNAIATALTGVGIGNTEKPVFFLYGNRYQDNIANLFLPNGGFQIASQYNAIQFVQALIWEDTSLGKPDINSFPLSYLFDGTGLLVVRSGWNIGSIGNPSDDLWARFQVGNWYFTHQHYDQGGFYIYKKGPLLTDGREGRAGTIYHNTIMIDNEDQSHTHDEIYTGREGWKNYGEGTGSDIADTVAYQSHLDYDYALGDITNAYNPNKLEYFHRHFVYLRPEYFVVFDRVKTKATVYGKKFLLNSFSQPSVNGSKIIIDSGIGGRLFVDSVLPAVSNIQTVDLGSSFDYAHEAANWRTEITPSVSQQEDIFLHILQATDDTTPEMVEAEQVNGLTSNIVGAKVADRVVIFGKDGVLSPEETIRYEINGQDTIKHLITSLPANVIYDIYDNGKKINTLTSQDSRTQIAKNKALTPQGTIYFETQPGSTREIMIISQGIVPDTTPPAQITDLSLNVKTYNSLTINWTATGDDGQQGQATSYDLRYSINPIDDANWGSAIQVADESVPKPSGQKETYTLKNLNPETIYYLALKAIDDQGNQSPLSNILQVTTEPEPQDTTPPAVPKNPSAKSSDSLVTLTWQANTEDDLAGYRVYRSEQAGQGYVQITETQQATYQDTNVINDTTYYYVLTAYDTNNNESSYSTEVNATPTFQGTLTFQEGDGGLYSRAEDTWLRVDAPNFNYGGPNTAFLAAGARPGLVRFPNIMGENPGQIPQGSTITSAILTLTTGSNKPANEHFTYQIKRDWGEGNSSDKKETGAASWNSAKTDIDNWGSPGCNDIATDRYATPTNAIGVVFEGKTTVDFDITSAVQNWANGEPNYGVIIIQAGDGNLTSFLTRGDGTVYRRPKLTVTYIPGVPDLTLTKSALVNGQPASEAQSGDIITYTIAYQNIGTGDAKNVIITDPIPQGASYVAGSAEFVSGLTGAIDDTTATIKWTISSVPAGQSGSVRMKVRVE